jgi:hypothetical protein
LQMVECSHFSAGADFPKVGVPPFYKTRHWASNVGICPFEPTKTIYQWFMYIAVINLSPQEN